MNDVSTANSRSTHQGWLTSWEAILCTFSLSAAREFFWTKYTIVTSVIIPILVVKVLQARRRVHAESAA